MELTPQLLIRAYMLGVFPMSEHRDDPEVVWLEPKRRGVFPLDGFHVSRSLARAIRKQDFDVRFDTDFETVLNACADRSETWINAPIRQGYLALFRMGRAHSIEVWRDGLLIGGVYGVSLGRAFFGESMFSRATNGSKIALAYLVTHLRKCGFSLFDTQFLTPHLASLGAVEIDQSEYLEKLALAIEGPDQFRAYSAPPSAEEVLHLRTQTS